MDIDLCSEVCFLLFVFGALVYLVCLSKTQVTEHRFALIVRLAEYALISAVWGFVYILSIEDGRADYTPFFGTLSLQELLTALYAILTALSAYVAVRKTYAQIPEED